MKWKRSFTRNKKRNDAPHTSPRLESVWLALLLAAFVCSSRLWILGKFGVQEPFMDSFSEVWDYKAAQAGRFDEVLRNSLSFHMEHRIFMTRWLNVGLFLVNNKQWDVIVQACFNAFLAGFCVLAIIRGFGSQMLAPAHWLFSGVSAICFALPIPYENILWGFQSQHFLFLLLSLVTISLMVSSRALSTAWWVGLVSGILSCVSLGSGFYALFTVAATCMLMLWRSRYRQPATWITLASALAILACYLPTLSKVHSAQDYRSDTLAEFTRAFLSNLAWPNLGAELVWLSLLMWLPWSALVFAGFFRRRALPRSSYRIIALGLWLILVVATLALLRGRASPSARYFDYNAFNVVVNAAAIMELSRLRIWRVIPERLRGAFLGAWLVMVAIGLAHLTADALSRDLPRRRAQLLAEQKAINRFFLTDDAAILTGPELEHIFPFAEPYNNSLAAALRDPEIQKFIPIDMKNGRSVEKSRAPLSSMARVLLRQAGRIQWASGFGVLLLVGISVMRILRSEKWSSNFQRVEPEP